MASEAGDVEQLSQCANRRLCTSQWLTALATGLWEDQTIPSQPEGQKLARAHGQLTHQQVKCPQKVGAGLTIHCHTLPLRVFHVLHQLLGQLFQLFHLLQGQGAWASRRAYLKKTTNALFMSSESSQMDLLILLTLEIHLHLLPLMPGLKLLSPQLPFLTPSTTQWGRATLSLPLPQWDIFIHIVQTLALPDIQSDQS